jgi:hypothetical protein
MIVYKSEIAMSIANALMALGKGDVESIGYHLAKAQSNYEIWVHQLAEAHNMKRLVKDAAETNLKKGVANAP